MTAMTDTIRVFDRQAAGYDQHFQRSIDHAEDDVIYEALTPWITGRSVLDVGCGTGALLDRTSPRTYLGLDASPNMLREARAKHGAGGSRRTFVCANVGRGSTVRSRVRFETVVCLWAFPYFAGQAAAVRWMARHLAPGGWLIVQGWSGRYRRREHHCAPPETIHPTTPDELAGHLERAGLADIDVQGFRWLGDHGWLERLPTGVLAGFFGWEARYAPPGQCLTHFAYGRNPARPLVPPAFAAGGAIPNLNPSATASAARHSHGSASTARRAS